MNANLFPHNLFPQSCKHEPTPAVVGTTAFPAAAVSKRLPSLKRGLWRLMCLVGGSLAVLLLVFQPLAVADPIAVVQETHQGAKGADGHIKEYIFYAYGTDGEPGGLGDKVSNVNPDGFLSSNDSISAIDKIGIYGESLGGNGGRGGEGWCIGYTIGGDGGKGGDSSKVSIQNKYCIITSGDQAIGIYGASHGGDGGRGGDGAGIGGQGGDGAGGGSGGEVYIVTQSLSQIFTQGTAAHGIFAQSMGGHGGPGGDGGGLWAEGGCGSSAGSSGPVTVNNGGFIQTKGDEAHGILAQSIGGFAGSGGVGAGIVGYGGDAHSGGDGNTVQVNSYQSIITSGQGADAIRAQSIGGGGGSAGACKGLVALGGEGAAGGYGGDVTINNSLLAGQHLQATGAESHGIFAQSIGGGGGHASSAKGLFTIGGSSSSGGQGGQVEVDNCGDISATSNAILAQSVGGGGGKGGLAVGVVVIGGKSGGGGNSSEVSVNNTGHLTTSEYNGSAILAQSVGGGGGSAGSKVSTGFWEKITLGGQGGKGGDSGTVGVTNYPGGSLKTEGKNSHGLQAQSIGGGGGSAGFDVDLTLSDAQSASLLIGGSGGQGGQVSVHNSTDITTSGANADGIQAQSIGGGGGDAGFGLAGSLGDDLDVVVVVGGGGGGGGGGAVSVTSDEGTTINTAGKNSLGVLAQSVGGGGGAARFDVSASLGTLSATAGFGGTGGSGGAGSGVTVDIGSNITTTGNSSHGLLAQSVGGGGGFGGFNMSGSLSFGPISVNLGGDGVQGWGGSSGKVSVLTKGDISTAGDNAIGLLAQSVGGGGGHSGLSITGLINSSSNSLGLSLGGNGSGNAAGEVSVTSTGKTIRTLGDRSPGISAQSIGGGGGHGSFRLEADDPDTQIISEDLPLNIGGGGGTNGNAGAVAVTNDSSISSGGSGLLRNHGHDSPGILAQSIGGGGGSGGFSIVGSLALTEDFTPSIGGRGGASGQGNAVTVSHSGDQITTHGDRSAGIMGQSVGGGGGSGGFTITGTLSQRSKTWTLGGTAGSSGDGGEVKIDNASNSVINTHGDDSPGIQIQSIGGGGGSGSFSVNAFADLDTLSINVGGGSSGGGQAGPLALTDNGEQIDTAGKRAPGILAQSIGGGGGSGGGGSRGGAAQNISVSIGGQNNVSGDGQKVTVTTSSSITTGDDDSPAILAQSIGAGGGFAGVNVADSPSQGTNLVVGAQIGGKGDGGAVEIEATGKNITTSGKGSPGLVAQSIGGGGGSGWVTADKDTGTQGSVTLGGNNASGQGGAVSITNASQIAVHGQGCHGIVAQSIGGGGGIGAVSKGADINLGGDVGDAGEVNLTNTGAINLSKDAGCGLVAQSIGGGGGLVSLTSSEAPSSFSGGLTSWGNSSQGSGKNVTVNSSGDISAGGWSCIGIAAQSLGGGGGLNMSSGEAGSAGGGGSSGNVTVKQAGNIIMTGDNSIGILAQSESSSRNAGNLTVNVNNNINMSGDNSVCIWGQSKSTWGSSGSVAVNVDGSIYTTGTESVGVRAQSESDSWDAGNLTVNVNDSICMVGAGSTCIQAQSEEITGSGNSVAVNINKGVYVEAHGNKSTGISVSTNGQANAGSVNITMAKGATMFVGPVKGTDPDSVALIINSDSNDITITNHGTITSAGKLLSTTVSEGKGYLSFTNYGTLSYHQDLTLDSGCTFKQADGKHTIDGCLIIKPARGSISGESYRLEKGELTTKGIELSTESCEFTQESGTNTVNGDISISSSGMDAFYNLNDGHLHAENIFIANKFDGASGIFNQYDGRNRVTGQLVIGLTVNCSGVYYLSGGKLHSHRIHVLDGGSFIKGKRAELECENIYIQQGGEFTGGGTVLGHVVSSGVMRPGNSVGTLIIEGSLVKNAGGRLHCEIASASDYDRVRVISTPGTFTLAEAATANGVGVTLEPELLRGSFRPQNNQIFPGIINVLGKITGKFSQVVNHPTLSWQAIYHPNSVDLMVERDYANPSLGLNGNQSAVAKVLNGVSDVTSGDLAMALNEIDYLADNAGVRRAYQEISPEKAAALSTLALVGASFQMRQQAQRLTDLRFGQPGTGLAARGFGALSLHNSSPDGLMLAYNSDNLAGLLTKPTGYGPDRRSGLYIYPSIIFGSQQSSANQTGFNFVMGGFTAGADYWLKDNLVVGLATGYSHNDADFKGSGGNVETNTWPLTAYATYLGQSWYAYGSLGYALNLFDLERNINFGGLSRTAKSSPNGHQLNVYTEAGYDVKARNVIVTPMASLAYSGLWVEGYQESGAGALNLKVGAQKVDSVQTGVGLKVAAPIKRAKFTVVPQAYASYQHEFANGSRGLNARLSQAGSTFAFQTDKAQRDFAVVGAKVDLVTQKNFQVGVNYNAEVGRGNYTAHSVYAGLRWNF
ncbi:MAG: autotransporter outer membrane beta-barrel domain-containing protein [Desulfobacca sp.]|nr:autotransporter outer membrane beta-barrel domain-containing protein [Desulfobacca sp.]